ncbi:hypothetical protein [Mycolicibacterium sphagni]|uniref:hypothetical protein n=1 Tax=Mycolicibacterium sphagni TaxID=1786 RepID=UPI0021F39ED5|nr:hypothetical protein [Mycolicibacterium sphagni]MCV7175715.1 hypothetical protein [Mycolicibacterium sphagni]
MTTDPFSPFEQMPPLCQAVRVTPANIDELAKYFHKAGYESIVHRDRDVKLVLRREKLDVLIVPLGYWIIQGFPPTSMSHRDFTVAWRTQRAML